jgi:hypothetical protein
MNRIKLVDLIKEQEHLAPFAESIGDNLIRHLYEYNSDSMYHSYYEDPIYSGDVNYDHIVDGLLHFAGEIDELRDEDGVINETVRDELLHIADIVTPAWIYSKDDLIKAIDLLTD